MILLWVSIGILLSWAIARINKSNKLFWILFTSFMVGIAGGHLYNRCSSESERNVPVIHPTSIVWNAGQPVTTVFETTRDVESELASQESPESLDFIAPLSKCFISKHIEPPNTSLQPCLLTLTHPDIGHT